jgi:hypothetical protein
MNWPKDQTLARWQHMQHMREAGATQQSIALVHGCTKQSVSRALYLLSRLRMLEACSLMRLPIAARRALVELAADAEPGAPGLRVIDGVIVDTADASQRRQREDRMAASLDAGNRRILEAGIATEWRQRQEAWRC